MPNFIGFVAFSPFFEKFLHTPMLFLSAGTSEIVEGTYVNPKFLNAVKSLLN